MVMKMHELLAGESFWKCYRNEKLHVLAESGLFPG